MLTMAQCLPPNTKALDRSGFHTETMQAAHYYPGMSGTCKALPPIPISITGHWVLRNDDPSRVGRRVEVVAGTVFRRTRDVATRCVPTSRVYRFPDDISWVKSVPLVAGQNFAVPSPMWMCTSESSVAALFVVHESRSFLRVITSGFAW
jgi:hypothetical protein